MAEPALRFGIGDPVPPFTLPDAEGGEHGEPLADAPPATVLIVTCMHCPYVIAWNPRLRAVAEEYMPRGVRFLGIHANDATRYPADSLDHVKRFVRARMAIPAAARRVPGRGPRGRDGLQWPQRDGLKWPHLALVDAGVVHIQDDELGSGVA